MLQRPAIGRTVIFRSNDHRLMGPAADIVQGVPATITHVYSDTCVNLMVMRDGAETSPIGVTSVCQGSATSGSSHYWAWPERS